MLIIEIALAIAAWQRGWRWKALLPLAFALGFGLLLGIAVGASGGNINQVTPVAMLGEVGVVIALIVMAVKKPAEIPRMSPIHASLPSPVPKV